MITHDLAPPTTQSGSVPALLQSAAKAGKLCKSDLYRRGENLIGQSRRPDMIGQAAANGLPEFIKPNAAAENWFFLFFFFFFLIGRTTSIFHQYIEYDNSVSNKKKKVATVQNGLES